MVELNLTRSLVANRRIYNTLLNMYNLQHLIQTRNIMKKKLCLYSTQTNT